MKKRVIDLITMPVIVGAAGVVGKTEGEGPLSQHFDYIFTNDGMGESTWESAEKALCKKAMDIAIVKSGLTPSDIEIAFGGDLVNQCTPSAFGMKDFNIPFAGLFGACSTFALGLALAALTVDEIFTTMRRRRPPRISVLRKNSSECRLNTALSVHPRRSVLFRARVPAFSETHLRVCA